MPLANPPTPKTPEQRTLDAINVATLQGIQQRVRTFTQLYNLVWKNQFGLTPPQAAAALGTNAKTLFTLAAQEQATLTAAAIAAGAPLATPLPGVPAAWAVTFDDAGNAIMTAVTTETAST